MRVFHGRPGRKRSSAYGAPVFMTGAGTVQTGSASDFETLYAGYRWDGESPRMYYVRNRFLLPVIGNWNRRDPLGYLDGSNLYQYCNGVVCVFVDPAGLQQNSLVRLPVRMPTNTGPGPRLAPTEDPDLPIRTPAASTHAVTHGHANLPGGPWYPTPNGPSLVPYYQEDYPRDLPIWVQGPWGKPGPTYNPNLPSRHDPNSWPASSRPFPECSIGMDPRDRRSCNSIPSINDPLAPEPICGIDPSALPSAAPQPSTTNSQGTTPRRSFCDSYPEYPKCTPAWYALFPFESARRACQSVNRRATATNPMEMNEAISGCAAPPDKCRHSTCIIGGRGGDRVDSVGSCICCDELQGLVTRWKTYRH